MGGFDWYVIKGSNCAREKCLAMAIFDMVVQFVVFSFGQVIKGSIRAKKKKQGGDCCHTPSTRQQVEECFGG